MTKPLGILTLFVLAAALALAPAFAQKAPAVDLAGTWSGYTILGDGTRAEFNMILAKADAGYTGKITDETGMIPEMAIKDVSFKDLNLEFSIDFPEGSETRVIRIGLKFENDTLKGAWVDPDGNSNIIELSRKK
jgi:hypothetical protein